LKRIRDDLETSCLTFRAVNIVTGARRDLVTWELGVLIRLLRANPTERLDKLLRLEIDFQTEYVRADNERLLTIYLQSDERIKALQRHEKRMIERRLAALLNK